MLPEDRHVALYGLGSGSMDLSVALDAAGFVITIVEPDPHDAERVRDLYARHVPQLDLALRPEPVSCDIFLCRSGCAGMAPVGTLIIVLDGPQTLLQLRDPVQCVAMDVLDPRFVEVVLGAADAATRARAQRFVERLGVPFALTTRGDAFAGTLLQDAALALVDRLLLAGTTPWELDEALEAMGFTQGLLKAQDHIGLDIAFARRRAAGTDLLVADRMVREGRLGRCVGVGWYRYPGGGGAVIDPLMEDMVVEEARFAGIEPTPLSDAEAAEALALGVINVAAPLLETDLPPQDLDRLALHKLGLPDMTRRARDFGLDKMVQRLEALQMIDADLWAPSPALGRFF